MSSGTVYPKGFKKIANIVGNSTTVAPEHVKERLQQLLQYYKTNKRTIHPLILAFDFHLEYEHIHPFQDGNGRTGRLLLNKILIDSGYCPMIVFKENSQAYFNALNQAISGNNKKQYYLFMLEQMRKSYKFLLAKV
jgi:Fic family protein